MEFLLLGALLLLVVACCWLGALRQLMTKPNAQGVNALMLASPLPAGFLLLQLSSMGGSDGSHAAAGFVVLPLFMLALLGSGLVSVVWLAHTSRQEGPSAR